MVRTSTTSKAPQVSLYTYGKTKPSKKAVPEYLLHDTSDQLIAQVVYTATRRARVRRAHTKERPDKRGGGKKPWRQKGTGRARHGSRRSPIWVGGGVTFGPRVRRETVSVAPTRQRRKALGAVFARHAANNTLAFVSLPDAAGMPAKTSEAASFLPEGNGKLLILHDDHKAFTRTIRNVPGIIVRLAGNVTVGDIVQASVVFVDTAALPVLESRVA